MMLEWWNNLGLAAQIFYCIAIPSTLVLLIQTLLMFLGLSGESDGFGDGDVDLDADVDADAPDGVFGNEDLPVDHDVSGLDGLRIFTVRGIIAFLVVFGWVGVVMESLGVALYISVPVAFVCGAAMMIALAFLFRGVMKLRGDGNLDNRNAIGKDAKVHLTIPPSRTGEGKVHLLLQGVYVEREAFTDDKEPIPTGSMVTVIGLIGENDLLVKRK
ncbi:MAG: hypothetical protein IKC31_07710 [Clostridia bacterium]|nr:hypothetical protein [Clostridia bacterium]